MTELRKGKFRRKVKEYRAYMHSPKGFKLPVLLFFGYRKTFIAGLLKVKGSSWINTKFTYLPESLLLLFTRESSIFGSVLGAGEGQVSESQSSLSLRVRVPSGYASWVKKDRTMSSMHRTTEGESLQESLVNKNKFPLLQKRRW